MVSFLVDVTFLPGQSYTYPEGIIYNVVKLVYFCFKQKQKNKNLNDLCPCEGSPRLLLLKILMRTLNDISFLLKYVLNHDLFLV